MIPIRSNGIIERGRIKGNNSKAVVITVHSFCNIFSPGYFFLLSPPSSSRQPLALGGRTGAAARGLQGHGLSRSSSCPDTASQSTAELTERFHRNAPFGWKQPLWLCWELCLSEPCLLTFVSPPGAAAAPRAARPLSGPSLGRCPKPPQGPLGAHQGCRRSPRSPSQGLQQFLEQKL